MDNELINPLNYSLAAKKELEENDYRGPFLGIQDAGFKDPNELISTTDLYGTIYESGVFFEMRYADPIIGSIMEFRKNSVSALEYNVIPKDKEPTDTQKMAAESVKWLINRIPNQSLNGFISHAYDQIFSFGFALYEMHVPEEGPNKGIMCLYHIPAFQVEWFNLDKTRTRLESVRVSLGDKIITIPASKLVWFGDMLFPGNYWGNSDLRKLMAIFSAKKQDLQNYLALRRLQQGILYFKENGEYPNNANSWLNAKNFLTQYFQGKPSPLLLNAGMDINMLNVSQPGVDNARTIFEYFDNLIREALGQSLKNLGIAGNGGSLALGKELAVTDAVQFMEHVSEFLMLLNGENAIESNFLEVCTELLGFDPKTHTPKLVVIDNTATDEDENIDLLIQMMKDGIITREDLPEGTIDKLLDKIGFSKEQE